MNLCVDQGNTYTKYAIFDGENMLECKLKPSFEQADVDSLYQAYPIKEVLISSVRKNSESLTFMFSKEGICVSLFSHETAIPVHNTYKTPETLGRDRLAAIIGAFALHPAQNILVIDAGTALTFDFITAEGLYLGGSISPGMQMRFEALHNFTQKLPLVQATGIFNFPGTTTEEAIRAGVVQGIVYEMNGYIEQLQTKYPKLLIFLTGGDCFFFESKLKNSIFANQNLVLIGLNRIINYNAVEK